MITLAMRRVMAKPAPQPCEWHPAYAGLPEYRRDRLAWWLEHGATEHAMMIDERMIPMDCREAAENEPLPGEREFVRILVRAPYLKGGHDASWWVAIDDLGRTIASNVIHTPDYRGDAVPPGQPADILPGDLWFLDT